MFEVMFEGELVVEDGKDKQEKQDEEAKELRRSPFTHVPLPLSSPLFLLLVSADVHTLYPAGPIAPPSILLLTPSPTERERENKHLHNGGRRKGSANPVYFSAEAYI